MCKMKDDIHDTNNFIILNNGRHTDMDLLTKVSSWFYDIFGNCGFVRINLDSPFDIIRVASLLGIFVIQIF